MVRFGHARRPGTIAWANEIATGLVARAPIVRQGHPGQNASNEGREGDHLESNRVQRKGPLGGASRRGLTAGPPSTTPSPRRA